MIKAKQGIELVIAIALSQAAGLIGSVFTFDKIPTWYAGLIKPSFNPPSWVFGPVWTLLYTLMGIAIYLVWQKGFSHKYVLSAVIVFGAQLVFNAMWSIVFFGWEQLGMAVIFIAVLWSLIVACIVLFWRIDRRAAYLMMPYLAWVSFASVLNISLWMLNK